MVAVKQMTSTKLKKKRNQYFDARIIIMDSWFLMECHIIEGFGDLFFFPAYTWCQMMGGLRAADMSSKILQWISLWRLIKSKPELFFTDVTDADVKRLLTHCANIAILSLQSRFGFWLQPPFCVAQVVHNQAYAKKLLLHIKNDPNSKCQFDVFGLLTSKIVFEEFQRYCQHPQLNTQNLEVLELIVATKFPRLWDW